MMRQTGRSGAGRLMVVVLLTIGAVTGPGTARGTLTAGAAGGPTKPGPTAAPWRGPRLIRPRSRPQAPP